ATLINGEDYGPARDGALGALWLAAEAFGNSSTNDELPNLPKLRGKRDLALNKLPRFLWFSDQNDLQTATKVYAQSLSDVLGASARFVDASVEITGDPVIVDIGDKLPWLKRLDQNHQRWNPIYLPNGLSINRNLFIGDAS